MKIVIATESYYPTISGVAVFSHYLALGLAKRGHEVHVICPSTALRTYDEKKDGVVIHRIRSRRNPFRAHHRNSFFAYYIIAHLLKEIKPDVVHLQDPLGTSKAVLRLAKRAHIPIVITNHFAFDYVLSYLPWLKPFHSRIAKFLERYLVNIYNQCDFITFPSETIRQQFDHAKLTVPSKAISNGVDLERFFPTFFHNELKSRFTIPHQPVVLHVGRLDQDKSADQVITAFLQVRQKIAAHLVVCGDGNKKSQLEEMIKRSNYPKAVTFTGFIDHDTLPQLYQLAAVFVTASTIETQGIVALEAMASALPLVVPKAGALPELVKDRQNGFLFTPGDTDEMAQKILEILANPKKAKEMGNRSLEMVEDHEIKSSYDKFESIYHQVTSSK